MDPLPRNSNFFFERTAGLPVDMISKHIHNLYELYYLERGACTYFIDNRIYDVRSGDILLIPKGLFHKTSYLSDTRSRTVMNFSSAYIPSPILSQISAAPFQIRSPSLQDEVLFYIRQIENNYRSDQLYANEILTVSLESLLLILFRNVEDSVQISPQKPICYNILQYIQEHYPEHLQMPDIARQFAVSESWLGKILKKECGLGFSEYLTSVRLQNARKMILSNPNRSISKIAYDCGYSDSNYFSVCFKRAFGVSPRSIRNKK